MTFPSNLDTRPVRAGAGKRDPDFGAAEISGEVRNGAMRYEGESHVRGGGKALRRMILSLTTADRVRQYSESSTDGGKTWSLAYDFTYLRQ